MGDITMVSIGGVQGDIPACYGIPEGEGPWPGVVVIHDALGMTEDVWQQVSWLVEADYLAVAPDLFHWAGRARCLFKTMRDLMKGNHGPAFDDLAVVREWLAAQSACSGKIGIVGFCFGGGYALALAPDPGIDAVAANYGAVADWGWEKLQHACPVIASFGAEDTSLKGQPEALEKALTEYGVPHEIKVYQGVGHGFMNQHTPEDSNWVFNFLSWASHTRFDEAACMDARERIEDFFDQHLR